jgi:hypothetical protein
MLGDVTKRLELNWIKAHVGYQGNEYADQLAVQAANTQAEFLIVPLAQELHKKYIKDLFYNNWSEIWISNHKLAKHTKFFFPIMNPKSSENILFAEKRRTLSTASYYYWAQ